MWNFIKELFGFEPKADAWVDRPNLRSQVEQEYTSRVVVIKQVPPSAPVKTPHKRTKKAVEVSAPTVSPFTQVDSASMNLGAIGLMMAATAPDVKSNPCADHSFASDPGSTMSSSDCSSGWSSGSSDSGSGGFSSGGEF